MKERPILFSGPMVRAILDGRKTQTRRIVKFDKDGRLTIARARHHRTVAEMGDDGPMWRPYGGAPLQPMPATEYAMGCPYGQPGDRLWVRETAWYDREPLTTDPLVGVTRSFFVDTDEVRFSDGAQPGKSPFPLTDEILGMPGSLQVRRPSIFMPRWACRLELKVTGVRVERLQDISLGDIRAEGVVVPRPLSGVGPDGEAIENEFADKDPWWFFSQGWNSINAKRGAGWDANPWVWVVQFLHKGYDDESE